MDTEQRALYELTFPLFQENLEGSRWTWTLAIAFGALVFGLSFLKIKWLSYTSTATVLITLLICVVIGYNFFAVGLESSANGHWIKKWDDICYLG